MTPFHESSDLAACGVALAGRELCWRIATDSGAFTRATSILVRMALWKISVEKLRIRAVSEGRAGLAWHVHEQLEVDFEPMKCRTNRTSDGAGPSRVYVGIDGFMLPMGTDGELGKRCEKAVQRRKGMKRTRGGRRAKMKRRAGAEQRFNVMTLVTLYDQDKTHRRGRATNAGVKQAGRLIRNMAADVKLRQSQEIVAVTDGDEWFAKRVQANLPATTTVILDYLHASLHVHQTRRTVLGEENARGNEWAEHLLGDIYGGGWDDAWELVVRTRSRSRSRVRQKSLDDLMRYLVERREKVDYASCRDAGYDVGSGPTESMCKSLSRRMKGIGMRWTGKNAVSMVALESLHLSGLWPNYWSTRLAA